LPCGNKRQCKQYGGAASQHGLQQLVRILYICYFMQAIGKECSRRKYQDGCIYKKGKVKGNNESIRL
jgi:hypothetical protein